MKASDIKNVPFLNLDYLYWRQKCKYQKKGKKRVIDLYFNQHKTYAEIAEIEHISPRDIHAIVKKEKFRLQNIKTSNKKKKNMN